MNYQTPKEEQVDSVLPDYDIYLHNKLIINQETLIKPKTKTVVTEERKTPHKQRIRELIKRPKEKFIPKTNLDLKKDYANRILPRIGNEVLKKDFSNMTLNIF